MDQATPPREAAQPRAGNGSGPGSTVTALIDGPETFQAMADALRTATGPDHFIYLTGWWLELNVPMGIREASRATLGQLLAEPHRQQVEVRALLWDNLFPALRAKPFYRALLGQNTYEVAWINRLPRGGAILDGRTPTWGSHHQKLLIINGNSGLIAFCGGIDISHDRIDQLSKPKGTPMHDVHCQITGPAAFDLLRVFLQRWYDHPDHERIDKAKIPPRSQRTHLLGCNQPVPKPDGPHTVEIGRTYPNGQKHHIPGGPYSFAPEGEQTAWQLIKQTIREARHYIYIEDQYLVSEDASRELQAALPNIAHVTILVTHDEPSDLPQAAYRRWQFLEPLVRAGGSKVRVFTLTDPGDRTVFKVAPHCYVHSKATIADDKVAIIGSANWNRRGFTHDSEIVARITDEDDTFAKRLRLALWTEHLDLPEDDLKDPVTDAHKWYTPGPKGKAAPYDLRFYWRWSDGAWDTIFDPDGS